MRDIRVEGAEDDRLLKSRINYGQTYLHRSISSAISRETHVLQFQHPGGREDA